MSRSLTAMQAILLGLAVCVGLGLAGVGVFAIGDRHWLWSDTFHVTAGFRQVHGVEVGTRVRIQGMDAGQVAEVLPPTGPSEDVVLRLRLSSKLRHLVRTDARVQIASEGMIGGKVVEILPGSPVSPEAADDARLSTIAPMELTDVLAKVQTTLEAVQHGTGTVGKLLTDADAYMSLVGALKQSQETLASVQKNSEAVSRLPVIRNYVEDPLSLLVRPNAERNRQAFADHELFEPGRAVLTESGKRRLDEVAPWLEGLKHKGSEVVVVAYADPKHPNPAVARTLTRQQSEAVSEYLKNSHAIQKMGLFSSRKVQALGLGTESPPVAEREPLPADRVEILVFVPQT